MKAYESGIPTRNQPTTAVNPAVPPERTPAMPAVSGMNRIAS
jgi:hypothetical protein